MQHKNREFRDFYTEPIGLGEVQCLAGRLGNLPNAASPCAQNPRWRRVYRQKKVVVQFEIRQWGRLASLQYRRCSFQIDPRTHPA
jgi:hypothetical protein